MDAQASPAAPESLLASAHHLQALVSVLSAPPHLAPTTPSSALLHPLGPAPPASLPALRTSARSTLTQLRSSLTAFSSLTALPSASAASTAPSADAPPKQLRDKYLTHLRDSAQSETTLLHLRQADASFAHNLLTARQRTYGALFPAVTPAEDDEEEEKDVLPTLERLAKELGLVGFRDDDGAEGEQDKVTLSLGGKVMVVDFEVVRVPAAAVDKGGKRREKVDRVKVAYIVAGADLICAAAGSMLQSLFAGEIGLSRAERWRAVRGLLEQLKELDEATERTGRDCFKALTEELKGAVEGAFSSFNPSSAPRDVPLSFPSLLPTPHSLTPSLLLHASPLALLSPSFSATLASPASISPFGTDTTPGVYRASLSLSAVVDRPLPPRTAAASSAQEAGGDAPPFIATLHPPVPVPASVGRAICAALELEAPGKAGEGGEVEMRLAEAAQTGGRGAAATVGLEDLLLPRRGEEGGKVGEGVERSWEITLPPPTASSASTASPLLLSFRLAPPSSSPSSPAYLATHLRFRTASQLQAALGVLEGQIRVGELVKGVERRAVAEREKEEQREGQGRKRRKVVEEKKEKEGMTLDELFAPSSSSSGSAPLPIYLHLAAPSPSSDPAPALTLTFPVPPSSLHSPGAPMALSISCPSSLPSVSPAAYRITVQAPPEVLSALGCASDEGHGTEGSRCEALEKVLEVAADLGLAVRWVAGKLERAT
ncbi:hypothetical protein JCM8097_008543 [Rhodosporidiobolus ruineniae]